MSNHSVMQMFKIALFLFFLFFSLHALSYKSTDDITKVNIATINTLLIFTSEDGLNSGTYHFTNTPADIDMSIYHLPFLYNFDSESDLNFFVVGNVGYSRVYLSNETRTLDIFNHIQTYTAGLGGGLRYKFSKDLSLLGGGELIYSRAGISVIKPDGDIGDIIEDFFNKNYSDNISYKFFTQLEYRSVVAEFKPYLSFKYKLYETKSSFSLSELSGFRSESSVTSFKVGVESPKLFEYNAHQNLTLEAYLNGHHLSGIVRDMTQVRTYRSLGGVAYWNTAKAPWWASRFFLELNRVIGDGLRGYNVGVGFTLDF